LRHELKTDPRTFAAVWEGTKLYEIRKDDRDRNPAGRKPNDLKGFQVSDELLLRETRFSGEQMKGGRLLEYTDREVLCVVTHKLTSYGLQEGWCILGIKRLELIDRKGPHDGGHWMPEQPEDFAAVMPSTGVGTVVGEGVKTRDPLYAGPNLEMKATSRNEAGDVLQYGPSHHMPAGTPTPKVMDMPTDIAKHYGKDFAADKTATALAVAWDAEGMPYCRNTHVMGGCKSCKVTLHARCSMAKQKVAEDQRSGEDRRIDAKQMSNSSGSHVSYYSVDIEAPSKGGAPYRAEAIDCIAALDMTFAEGEAFKAVWRCAADRIGAHKEGNDTRRDAEKVAYYGEQMTAREKKRHG